MSSAFDESIWRLVRAVPPGRVTTYAELAEAHYGVRRGARSVGGALARCPDEVPWWRVVRADGSFANPAADEQRSRLREEGVEIGDRGVVWGRRGPWSPPTATPVRRSASR